MGFKKFYFKRRNFNMKIFVVDNGGQWTHREWRVLRDLGIETKIIPNTAPLSDIEKEDVDGLVLSGGSATIAMESVKLGLIGEYLDRAKFPILGKKVNRVVYDVTNKPPGTIEFE